MVLYWIFRVRLDKSISFEGNPLLLVLQKWPKGFFRSCLFCSKGRVSGILCENMSISHTRKSSVILTLRDIASFIPLFNVGN